MSGMHTSAVCVLAVLLCRLTIGITGLHWLISGDKLSFAVAAVALLLTALPTLCIRDSHLHDVTAVVVALLLVAHIVLGMQIELYETSKLYDKAMHMLGSGAIAGILIITIHTYCSRRRIELPLTLIILLVFGGTLSAGTLWEILEFAIDRTGLFNAQRGLHDTMLDLLADATGAVLATSVFAATIWIKNNITASWLQLSSVVCVGRKANSTRPLLRLADAN